MPESESVSEDRLGEVFTRPWVVEMILDLAGYTVDLDLGGLRTIEPACGEGAFVGPIVDRLLTSALAHGRPAGTLNEALRAYDLSHSNVERTRKLVVARLVDAGLAHPTAEDLAEEWIRLGDFLLETVQPPADFVVGNPPYIRLEDVPTTRMAAYRMACPSMRGRSDVYIGFIEKGLRTLNAGGVLGYIVADRWMHNQYGSHLRRLVADEFSVETVVEMHDAAAFDDQVSAYPAVTLIRRVPQTRSVLATTDKTFGEVAAARLTSWCLRGRSSRVERPGFRAARLPAWFPGDELWPSGDPDRLSLIADIERRFPSIESKSTRTRVRIGVATGADSVFITRDSESVETDRLLPLITAPDIVSGRIEWSGTFLVNPWQPDGLVDLAEFPRLSKYLFSNEHALRSRHVASKRPSAWYRTIDRVAADLLSQPKLLLADLKASSQPVLDEGHFYPHHNLYFVTSDSWDLEVLGGLLLSHVTNHFIGAYCVKMRGGCYRFQAQYLRKIRVPDPRDLTRSQERSLRSAFQTRDVDMATAAAAAIFGVSEVRADRT